MTNAEAAIQAAARTFSALDPRYADLVARMRQWHYIALHALARVEPDQSVDSFNKHWDQLVLPGLVETLDAFVGPPVATIEACAAYHSVFIPWASQRDGEERACSGAVDVAVVERAGSPQSPGRILRHIPGCGKHARKALSSLDGRYRSDQNMRVFPRPARWYQIGSLSDVRLELRMQELEEQRARRRRWWRW